MSSFQSMVDSDQSNRATAVYDNDRLIKKYNVSGPRYTSYPSAVHFSSQYDREFYTDQIEKINTHSIAPLSLYVHIPFCQNICYYCACNKVVSSDKNITRRYLDYLCKEIAMQSEILGKHRPVMQLHFGGGTPTFLDGAELTELMYYLASHFYLTDSGSREYSIEVDPRSVTADSLALLKGLGFNRISLGVQDFNTKVQKAVNRVQSIELVKELTDAARLYQFKSISYDLIYGLPKQTLASLIHTLDQVISLSPDRIAFYNYAHLPERFSSQRAIDRQGLPSPQDKIDMLAMITRRLVEAGYLHIGMDHFVKPADDLAVAQRQGKLQRNFQGYATSMAPDLIGLGVSAISVFDGGYVQNDRELTGYYQRLDNNELAIDRGYKLSGDDCLRRAVIMQLICKLQVKIQSIENQYMINFSDYFSRELDIIKDMEVEGVVSRCDETIQVTEHGRIVLRNICMVFDSYLNHQYMYTSDTPIKYSSAL